MMLIDRHDRIADYLRIGVTDRCNLRCRYCMPAEGIDFGKRSELLTDDEMVRLATIMVDLGVKKIRLTGGEPLARRGIRGIMTHLSALGVDLRITTNGILLRDHFDIMRTCDVQGINVSIDSLDRYRFMMITRRDTFEIVQETILEARSRDLPIKLNTVVMKGVNDDEINDFIAFGMEHGAEVRFIEAMPFNEDDGNKDVFMPATDIAARIAERYPMLTKMSFYTRQSADQYQIGDYRLGIIPSYSRTLCASCNRIRLTPKGELLTCLYSETGVSLRDLMRSGMDDDGIKKEILQAVKHKKRSGHDEEKERSQEVFQSMTSIGG